MKEVMKNNRKNRKLKFIRTKNNLRLGQTSFCVTGRANQQFMDNYTDLLLLDAKDIVFRKYKLILNNISVSFGHEGNDFVKGFITYKIKIQK